MKNALQERCQQLRLPLPIYRSTASGPAHDLKWLAIVQVNGQEYVGQLAQTKKEAEQSAAKQAVQGIVPAEKRICALVQSKHLEDHLKDQCDEIFHFQGDLALEQMALTAGRLIERQAFDVFLIVSPNPGVARLAAAIGPNAYIIRTEADFIILE